jgi:hypothetical protein
MRERGKGTIEAARAAALNGEPTMTLRVRGPVFLRRCVRKGLRSMSVARLQWRVHVEGDPIADVPLRDLGRSHVLAWVDRVANRCVTDRRGRRTLARGTVQSILNLLRAVLTFATGHRPRGSRARGSPRGPVVQVGALLTPPGEMDRRRAKMERECSRAIRQGGTG